MCMLPCTIYLTLAVITWVLVPSGKFIKFLFTSNELAKNRWWPVVSCLLVLAGIIGGLLGQGMSASDAARAAVYLHGAAAEQAPAGTRSLVADDLLTLIGPALTQLTPFA